MKIINLIKKITNYFYLLDENYQLLLIFHKNCQFLFNAEEKYQSVKGKYYFYLVKKYELVWIIWGKLPITFHCLWKLQIAGGNYKLIFISRLKVPITFHCSK